MAEVLMLIALLQDPVELVAQLGAETVRERDDAEDKLRKLGLKAVDALHTEFESADPEVRFRVRRALRAIYGKTFGSGLPYFSVHALVGEWDGKEPPKDCILVTGPESTPLVIKRDAVLTGKEVVSVGGKEEVELEFSRTLPKGKLALVFPNRSVVRDATGTERSVKIKSGEIDAHVIGWLREFRVSPAMRGIPRTRESANKAAVEKYLASYAEKGTLQVKATGQRVKCEDNAERETIEIRFAFSRREFALEEVMHQIHAELKLKVEPLR